MIARRSFLLLLSSAAAAEATLPGIRAALAQAKSGFTLPDFVEGEDLIKIAADIFKRHQMKVTGEILFRRQIGLTLAYILSDPEKFPWGDMELPRISLTLIPGNKSAGASREIRLTKVIPNILTEVTIRENGPGHKDGAFVISHESQGLDPEGKTVESNLVSLRMDRIEIPPGIFTEPGKLLAASMTTKLITGEITFYTFRTSVSDPILKDGADGNAETIKGGDIFRIRDFIDTHAARAKKSANFLLETAWSSGLFGKPATVPVLTPQPEDIEAVKALLPRRKVDARKTALSAG